MEKDIKTNSNPSLKTILKSIFWILILAIVTLLVMVWISPDAKGLPVFLIVFFIAEVIVVLLALYINYAVNIYKQIKKN